MADMDKLKEKIAEAIAAADNEVNWDYVRSIPNHPIYGLALEQAEAALTAIESAGFVLMPKDQILRKMTNDEFSELMAGIPFRENADG
jgi:hypothetical protein